MEKDTTYVNIDIQDHTGDRKLRLSWETGNSEAAQKAQKKMEELFLDLQMNGYRFFTCKKTFGLFPRKGKEVKTYDGQIGELIYELDESKQIVNEPEFCEVEKTLVEKYEEPKKFDPEIDELDVTRNYVATKPMQAG